MLIKNKNFNRGFTLVEIMIAITLFTAIMTIGTGAVLQTNSIHKKAQTMRSVMDNLNFIMEDMVRNMRLGSNYHCPVNSGDLGNVSIEDPALDINCASSLNIAFESVSGASLNPSDQIVYSIVQNSQNPIDPNLYSIIKSKDGGANFVTITPDEVSIDPNKSGFTVIGAQSSLSGDQVQPRVIIRLVGVVKYKNMESSFNLQTTVSQRFLDL